MNTNLPNKEAFNLLYEDIKRGTHGALNLLDIHRVFGEDFFELMICALCCARDETIDLINKNNKKKKK